MLITKDLLIQIIKDYINRLLRRENSIVAVYLTGSVLEEQPFIGGSTDIDLVIVHSEEPPLAREIKRLKNNISFDIVHHHQSLYTYHRRMRQDPWLGHALRNHDAIMYDTNHWLEYIQAGVDSQFDMPENTYARAIKFFDEARAHWFELDDDDATPFSEWLNIFLKAVGDSSNAIAALNGPGLTQRRMMLEFPARAEALNQLTLVGELAHLIGNDFMNETIYQEWRPVWENALDLISQEPDCPANLHKARKAYFLDCCDSLVENGSIHAVLWPILETWRQAEQYLRESPSDSESRSQAKTVVSQDWLRFVQSIGFSVENKENKTKQLGRYIESINHALENWKREYGL
mgnify:CR=1 FL=1